MRRHLCAPPIFPGATTAILACAAWFSLIPTTRADVPTAFGINARAVGMANTHTAVHSGAAANVYNPAALALVPNLALEVAYLATDSSLRLNGIDTQVAESRGLSGAVAIPGDIGPVRVALGLALHLPNDYASRIRALPQSRPRFALFDNRNQRLTIAANLAIRLLPELAIGAGLSFLADTRGGVTLRGTFYPEADRTALTTQVKVDFETVRAPRVGVHWTPRPDLALALVWHGAIDATLALQANVQGNIAELLGPDPLPGELSVTSDNTDFFSPHRVVLGAQWNPAEGWLVALDAAWEKWSDFPAPTAAIGVDFKLQGFDTSNLIPLPDAVRAPGFRDIFTARLAAEASFHLAPWLTLRPRLGYAFEPSPAPHQTGTTNYADSARHTASLGLGVGLFGSEGAQARAIEWDVAVSRTTLSQRSVEKTNPADPVGDYSANGHIWVLATGLRFSLSRPEP